MQTATSATESKSLDLRICVRHYTLRAPCPEGQGTETNYDKLLTGVCGVREGRVGVGGVGCVGCVRGGAR